MYIEKLSTENRGRALWIIFFSSVENSESKSPCPFFSIDLFLVLSSLFPLSFSQRPLFALFSLEAVLMIRIHLQ